MIFSPKPGMVASAILGPVAEVMVGKDIKPQFLREGARKG